ncbi:xanthine dehydrogenase family protein subunit M [Natrarchaeobius halalkaliphilus]|uniref:Xanthine dehydrogenase family protein subunit M n=1 Tax=Natrarchaeobius halalkaliphilus TaxID=1679091 RepID=A0A3N6MGL4_9EURY|nr:xanthine dehydrogenase family protein subunit M [Natrarchaeobius halalkaliphilus]RQG93106.1 xanthine dehydrogenase family protein subunit M [Natrarchaeobius halalkaliphilus]
MKPAPFTHHRPDTVEDVLELLAELEEAELLAGNQSLGIVMANRLATPDHLIDLNGVDELAGIDVTDGVVRIGAMTRHRTLERSDRLASVLPMVPEAAEQIAGPSVRNQGTLGGSIGEADPAGNYPAALIALDGSLHLRSLEGRRDVPAEEYFIAYMFTELREDELIESVSIQTDPFPPERTGMAFLELKRAAQTWPTVSAATALRVDDPTAADPIVEDVRIALANAADVPLRVEDAEAVLEGEPMTESGLDEVAELVTAAVMPEGEMHADREYKENVAGEYARRSLETSYQRAVHTADGV